MRLRNIPGSREAIAESQYVIHEEETRAGSWHLKMTIPSILRSAWVRDSSSWSWHAETRILIM